MGAFRSPAPDLVLESPLSIPSSIDFAQLAAGLLHPTKLGNLTNAAGQLINVAETLGLSEDNALTFVHDGVVKALVLGEETLLHVPAVLATPIAEGIAKIVVAIARHEIDAIKGTTTTLAGG